MTKEELIKGLKVLGLAYNKSFTEEECVLYYDFLSKYSYETFKNAVKELIQISKFLPKISEILEYCEKNKISKRYKILDLMRARGYFKTQSEYEIATHFIENDIIPRWLKEDMKEYSSFNKELENNTRMIGG